jgi:integrase
MQTNLQPVAANPEIKTTHRFDYDGHTYRLYRRPKLPTGVWYLDCQIRGRHYQRSTDTTIQKNAEAAAKTLIKAIKDERWDALSASRSRREFATLESIIAAYETAPERPAAADRNVYCFRLLLRRATGRENLTNLTAAALDAKLIRDYKAAVLAPFADPSAPVDKAELNRAKRSANSILRQARSLFAKKILSHYTDAGVHLPDLDPFLNEPPFTKVPKPDYQVPDDVLIQRTFRALHKLRTSGHPEKLNRFKAVCLALGAGLRKSEMSPVSWDWFKTVNDHVVIRGEKICKNNKPLDLPFQSEVWTWLQSVKPADTQPTDPLLLVGCKTHIENIFRKISKWMRKLGWKTQKKIHELRAVIISRIAEEHGIIAARDFARHGDIAVTQPYARHIRTSNVDVQLTAGGA